MTDSLTMERCFDVSIIYGILHNPEIWDSITEDGTSDFMPDVVNDIWMGFWTESAIIGAYKLNKVSSIMWQIHANILPEYRALYAKKTGRMILKYCLENIDGLKKLVAVIPSNCLNVYHFTRKQGFKQEGENMKSYMKNGKLYNQFLLGMTLEELKEQVRG